MWGPRNGLQQRITFINGINPTVKYVLKYANEKKPYLKNLSKYRR